MRCAHVRRFTFPVVIVLMVWMIPTPMLAQDPCDPGPNFTDSSSLVVLLGNSVACSSVGITADNGYYRNFDLAANGIMAHQFQNGPPPPAPYPACDSDPDPGNSLGCDGSACP